MEIDRDKVSPFTFIDSINTHQQIEDKELIQEEYSSYLTNRQMSLFIDTIFYANEMNLNPDINKYCQYLYYLNSVKPKKRFSRWPKKIKSETLDLISSYYGVNLKKAKEYLSLLTEEQIAELMKRTEKGGKG